MTDLFGWASGKPVPTYPDAPGFKRAGTSKDAARAAAAGAGKLRDRVLAAFRTSPEGLTADEAADMVGRSVLSVRPRVAELHVKKLIYETAERRRNAISGATAAVWKARPAP